MCLLCVLEEYEIALELMLTNYHRLGIACEYQSKYDGIARTISLIG
jgi:hypothetical protein